MPKFQPSRSQVPVDERSVLATVPGLPWWGAVLTLLVFTGVGALASGELSGANAGMWAIAVGAIVAVLAVRNRALFTAIVQPALVIAITIPVYRWFSLPSPRSTSLIVTDVLFPLISLFPWMFFISVIVLGIGIARWLLYRNLTATARNAQRSAAASAAKASKASKTSGKTVREKANEARAGGGSVRDKSPFGDRVRAAFSRATPAPLSAATAGAGAASLTADAAVDQPESQRKSNPASRAKSRAARERDRARNEARAERAARAREQERAAGRPHLEPSAGRREPARRDDSAPATQINRVVRPGGPAPRPSGPTRRPVDDGVPHGARPRPAVARGDRPRPSQQRPPIDRDPRSREPRGVDPSQGDPRQGDPRRRGPRPPQEPRSREARERDSRSGREPRSSAPAADSRDYRREARDIDRARGNSTPQPRAEREPSRIPRDDFASLPRISGSRTQLPDLPSLSGETERPSRRGDTPSAPGRYEHYRAPRYRPQSDESPLEKNFRDDFDEPEKERREIRRHRYKD